MLILLKNYPETFSLLRKRLRALAASYGKVSVLGPRVCGAVWALVQGLVDRGGGTLEAFHSSPFHSKEASLPKYARRVGGLVEKLDTELFSILSAKSSNFRRLVLSCIKPIFASKYSFCSV